MTVANISVDEIRTFARCGLEWFWEKRAGVPRPSVITVLLPEAMRLALGFYYQGYAGSLVEGVQQVWQDWSEGWGDPALAQDLLAYAEKRAAILKLIVRRDGTAYTAPQLTTDYKTRMHASGATALGRRLDDFARTHGLLLNGPPEQERPGSVLGDVCAESLAAAGRAQPSLPDPAIVAGGQVPIIVDLPNGVRVIGQADLVYPAAEPEAGVVIEVHEFAPQPWLSRPWAGRDLRVIVALLARAADEAKTWRGEPLSWKSVERVVYRNFAQAEPLTFREANSGHLVAVVSAVVRGMGQHLIIPRALTGKEICWSCAYHAQCWGEGGWDALGMVNEPVVGAGEDLVKLSRNLRRALGANREAAQLAQSVLAQVEAALGRADADPLGQRAVLGQAQQALTEVADAE
jgi:hypothetical protein